GPNGTDVNGTNGTGGNGTGPVGPNGTGNGTGPVGPNGTDVNGTNGTDENLTNDTNVYNSNDLQDLINNTKPGETLDLGNKIFENVSNIVISKDINIVGGNISSDNSSNPIFTVLSKSQNGPNSVNISSMTINANNKDVIIKIIAENDTNPLIIDIPEVNFKNNTVGLISDDVIPELVTVLELDSERGILSPNNPISIEGNNFASGINPFEFKITSIFNGSDVNVPIEHIIPSKESSVLHYQDMDTIAINQKIEGRVGKYFEVNLTDKEGKPLANKFVQIGFNGAIYNRTTNATGGVRLQINLGYKGTYTFAVSFLGDNTYNGSFIVAKIVVNTQKTKLATANKSFKSSAKTKTLTATLKDASGNVINGKKVTFTVNGKAYSATTNSKGVASVKVSLSTKKTYSFTVKFAGDNMYTASSVKGKVTVK
ncbi:MAG: Ig-like domain repeat protein, partial [Methanobrevibacter sp.]|nr:Ig-like domain repeat protein [Methanobrevibacter sp.]